MILKSKIKSMFSDDLLKLIANICDTRFFDSNQKKMKLLQQLLVSNNIQFEVLGGATNRIALLIDTYAVKFAMDEEGYRDNFMEYSLSAETQPYTTKSYETNGYILVAECVKTMTLEEFNVRRADIKAVLNTLGADYLLGDVGLVKRNFTNWGVRDNGSVVILDYAYMHRATEGLFTCDTCGDGFLTYSEDFTKLICSNKSVCGRSYTYDDRKRTQGVKVDIDMIDENKSASIIMGEGISEKEITNTAGDLMMDDDIVIINNESDVLNIRKELFDMAVYLNNGEISDFDDLVEQALLRGTTKNHKPITQEVEIPKDIVPRMAVSSDCEVTVAFDDKGVPYIVEDNATGSDSAEDSSRPELSFDELVDFTKMVKSGTIFPTTRDDKHESSPDDDSISDLIDKLLEKKKGEDHNG